MRQFFFFAIFLFTNNAFLFSQETAKKLYVANKCTSVIIVDGNLTEGKWEGGFIQHEPYENAKPSQLTEFRLLFDNDFIYVAIKAHDTAPDSIVSRLTRKDKSDGDWVGLAFDSYHDLRTAFGFFVSAAGVKTDEIFTEDGNVEDITWDPIWYVQTRKQSWGWSAEMKSENYNDRDHIYDTNQLSGPDAGNNYLVDENRDGKTDYRFENSNFNFNEFLSNLVLRWEYLPGSTLYLVWSQNRRYESTSGDLDLSHNLDERYSYEKPNNTLMNKLSFRIALH